jgi:signal transduction histidine kinase
MFMKSLIASAALVVMSLATAQAHITPVTFTIADEAQQNLEKLRSASDSVNNDADVLRMAAKNVELSPDGHRSMLAAMRDSINQMGRTISSLQAEHEALPTWEQKAISKAEPLLQNAAENTDKAIDVLNKDENYVWNPAYTASLDKIYQDSKELTTTLDDYLKLAQLRQEERHVEGDLSSTANR